MKNSLKHKKFTKNIDFNFLLLLLLLLFLNTSSCNRKKNNQEEITVKAYRLIDEQRTSEAIDLLEDELKKNPNKNELKYVLASAYSHKAGIKIQKIVPVITQLYRLNHISSKLKIQETAASRNKNAVYDSKNPFNISTVVLSLLNKTIVIVELFESIPVVDSYHVEFLKHSIELLSSIGSEMTQDQALFKVVLEVVLFKYFVMDIFSSTGTIDVSSVNNEKCSVSINKVYQYFSPLLKILIEVFTDLGKANPTYLNSMNKLSQDISLQLNELELIAKSSVDLAELSSTYLKRTVYELGLGKTIKCLD